LACQTLPHVAVRSGVSIPRGTFRDGVEVTGPGCGEGDEVAAAGMLLVSR
jgi:hypothetical protein